MDERDVEMEMAADGYRVMIIYPGRRTAAYNLDNCTATDAHAWAIEHSGDGEYALASRVDKTPWSGVTLTWLTPLPEDIMDSLPG